MSKLDEIFYVGHCPCCKSQSEHSKKEELKETKQALLVHLLKKLPKLPKVISAYGYEAGRHDYKIEVKKMLEEQFDN